MKLILKIKDLKNMKNMLIGKQLLMFRVTRYMHLQGNYLPYNIASHHIYPRHDHQHSREVLKSYKICLGPTPHRQYLCHWTYTL